MSQERGRRSKYSPEFRRQALDRMKGCTNVTALARELGIRRKWLYAWRQSEDGYVPARRSETEAGASKEDKELERLNKKVAELERLAGRQAAELDFFKGALRRIKELRRNSSGNGGAASTNRSES